MTEVLGDPLPYALWRVDGRSLDEAFCFGSFSYVSGSTPTGACSATDPKLAVVTELLHRRFGRPSRVLAVGCGDGTEAAVLADLLGCDVVGIDIADDFHPDAREKVELVVADAAELPFADGSFDLVFSYHALEHIPRPIEAIGEMRRVVRDAGGLWVGAPNRSRLFGYLGSRDASTRDKIGWNISDWRQRLRGRFRNEFGAHAGFTRGELHALLGARFPVVVDETPAYYALLYPRHRRVLSILERLHLAKFVFPAVYFSGRPS
jgi:SAM-dependent methyltransferase